MGLKSIYHQVHRGFQTAKGFLGNAYAASGKFLSGLDKYAGVARGVIGEVAPMAGALTGPVGTAVGAGVGTAMKGLGVYDRLKTEAMTQAGQLGNVAAAANRGLR